MLDSIESNQNLEISDEVLSQLSSMGYDLELCRLCLGAFENNLQKAVNFFLENKNDMLNVNLIKEKLQNVIEKKSGERPCSSKEDSEKTLNAQKIISNLAQEMPDDDEAYLDFNIEEDAFYINKYFSLLES